MSDGLLWSVWIDYDGADLEVRANQTGVRPVAAMLSRALDVSASLGQPTAFVGFTSGTGADWGNHDIVSWEYRDEFDPIGQVPLPRVALLSKRFHWVEVVGEPVRVRSNFVRDYSELSGSTSINPEVHVGRA